MTMTERNSLLISTWSKEGPVGHAGGSAPTSGAYPAANRAHYYPLRIARSGTVRKLWWMNGATVGTDNVQMALYRADGVDGGPGNLVVAGTSTLTSGANAPQYDDITDAPIAAGTYWVAVWANGTTTTMFRSNVYRGWGVYIESSLTGGLPATATPAAPGSTNFTPLIGLQMRAAP